MALCVPQARAAQVQGRVVLDGPSPPPEVVTIEPKTGVHSTEGCGSLQKDSPKLRVGPDGGVRDAVVWLETEPQERAKQEALRNSQAVSAPVMDQSECVFSPHVLAIPAGGPVALRNSDRVVHNVRIFREGKPDMLMHRWQKVDAADIRWKFEEPGRYLVRCGVHPWMYGWVFVVPRGGAGAATDASGRFALAEVPAGRHTLRIWHETLGESQVEISVGAEGVELEPIHLSAAEKKE